MRRSFLCSKLLKGSISIFMCVVILGVSILGCTLFTLVHLRSIEQQLNLLAHQQADAVLSCYHRPIFERFGILAFAESAPDQLDQLIKPSEIQGELMIDLSTSDALSQGASDSLKRQIYDFMNLRIYRTYVTRIRNLIQTFKRQTSGGVPSVYKELPKQDWTSIFKKILKQQTKSAHPSKQTAEDESTIQVGTGLFGQMNDADQASMVGQDTNKWSEQDAKVADDFKLTLNEAMAADTSFLGEYKIKNLLDIEPLLKFISQISDSIDRLPQLFPDQLRLNQYVVHMLQDHVRQHAKMSKEDPYRMNARGMLFKNIHSIEDHELEQVIWGLPDDQSQHVTFATLFGIRALVRLVDIMTHKPSQTKALIIGSIVSVLLGVVSAGSVIIDPQTLKYVILFIQAMVDGYKDMKQLLQGGANALFGYHPERQINLYYEDYLSVFLMLVPESMILTRLGRLMEKMANERLYTDVRVRLDWYDPYQFGLHRQYEWMQNYLILPPQIGSESGRQDE